MVIHQDIDINMPLSNGLIDLRPLTLDDAKDLHEMMSDEYLCDKAGLSPHTHIHQTMDFILTTNHDVKRFNQILYGIFDEEDLVGMINMFNIDHQKKSGEYGYFINSDKTRKGYMKQAITLLSNHLIKEGLFKEINVYVDLSNKASLALAKSLKMIEMETSVEEDLQDRTLEMKRFIIKDVISC